jgi:hypothetical protein
MKRRQKQYKKKKGKNKDSTNSKVKKMFDSDA